MAATKKPETPLGLTRRARKMVRLLEIGYPDAHCELDFTNPLELLVAVVLSAQTTDVRVNQVTPALFQRYRKAADYASADRTELEEYIRPTGFYRNKATSLIGLGSALVERFGGEVPGKLTDLVTLPGVGRKTANVVLGDAFGLSEGVVVDTHVQRLSQRLGWSRASAPEQIERDLVRLFPQREWGSLAHVLIFHGRRVCKSRKPDCPGCVLNHVCPSARVYGY